MIDKTMTIDSPSMILETLTHQSLVTRFCTAIESCLKPLGIGGLACAVRFFQIANSILNSRRLPDPFFSAEIAFVAFQMSKHFGGVRIPHSNKDKPTPFLRNTVLGDIDNFGIRTVTKFFKLLYDIRRILGYSPLLALKMNGKTMYIFEYERLWLDQLDKPYILFNKLVTRIAQIPFSGQRKTLARRAPGYQIHLAF